MSKRVDFKDRFKGKTSMMNKEGHLGVASSSTKPITKIEMGNTPSPKHIDVGVDQYGGDSSVHYEHSPSIASAAERIMGLSTSPDRSLEKLP